MGFTERELRDLIQRTIDLKRCRSTEEALCRQLAETYKKFDFNSITNRSVCRPVYARSISMRGNERNSRRSYRLNQ